ncbi:MAG: GNAT family N-acetyltransferase [Alphaproteobacteria bacterium]|nr:GNAT family N-acetyltransferase [Alphaproteobacteria bacterium]
MKKMRTAVERLTEFQSSDLEDLCQATEEAIIDGLGFEWLKPPGRRALETYWRGVLLVPERQLFVARLDGTIVGTGQLVLPTRSNQAGAFDFRLTTFFVTPWARGHGLARGLLREVEDAARRQGAKQISLEVRATQDAAIHLYETSGYVRWGIKPRFALIRRKYIEGYYYTKDLTAEAPEGGKTLPVAVATRGPG